MGLDEQFSEAKQQVTALSERPSNEVLLQLYALYKQGLEGDVEGKRPEYWTLFRVDGEWRVQLPASLLRKPKR